MKQNYCSPVLEVFTMGQTDVIRTSNYEAKDVLRDDFGDWDE